MISTDGYVAVKTDSKKDTERVSGGVSVVPGTRCDGQKCGTSGTAVDRAR